MKLSKAEIFNYKSIGSQCDLDLNTKATILVGKSNVGKSNVLKAIKFAFNNDPLEEEDRCSWNENETKCVRLTFDLEGKDRKLYKEITSKLNNKKQLIVTKYIDGKKSIEFYPPVEEKTVAIPINGTIETLTNVRTRTRKSIKSWNKIASDHSLESSSDIVTKKIEALESWAINDKKLFPAKSKAEQLTILEKLRNELIEIRSRINNNKYEEVNTRGIKSSLTFLLSDFDNFIIPSIEFKNVIKRGYTVEQILSTLPELKYVESDENYTISDKLYFDQVSEDDDHFMNLLIKLSGNSISKLTNLNGRIRGKEFEDCKTKLSSIFSQYWNQEDLIVTLREGNESVNESFKNEEGETVQRTMTKNYYELDIIDSGGHWGSINDQGPGFRWFLWFVVRHLIDTNPNDDLFLILDEPALHLHASAQHDLLERFDKSLDARIQYLYTTHSPFLINKNYPHRIRSVQKGSKDENQRGTRIIAKPYHSSNGNPWEPIRSAIGLSAGASLYVGGNNLIVEGITDQIILSSVAQNINRVCKKSIYNLNKVSICFGGDEANSIALALFCNQEKQSVKLLFDSDTIDKKKRQLKKGGFDEKKIFDVENIVKNKIDIEDLIKTDYYHTCFLQVYEKIDAEIKSLPENYTALKNSVNKPTQAKWGRSKYYEEYFKKRKDIGKFSKILVAKKLAENAAEMEKPQLEEKFKDIITVLDKVWKSKDDWTD